MTLVPSRPLAAVDTDELLARVLTGQDALNRTVADALQAIVLSQERYEVEIAELRNRIILLERRAVELGATA